MLHGDLLGERARLTPEKLALVDVSTGGRFTYRDLDVRAGRCARLLRTSLGLAPGDRVGLLAGNRVEYLDIFFATARSGIVLVPLGTRLTPAELAHIVRDSGMRALIHDGDHAATIRALKALVTVESWVAVDAPADDADASYGACLAAASPRPLGPRSLRAGGRLRAALHQRHDRPPERGDDSPPDGVVERLQHGRVLAAARRRREPDFHAAVSCGRARGVPDADGGDRGHDRPAQGVRRGRGLAHDRRGAVHGRSRRATIWKMLMEAPEFATADLSHVRWFISGGAPLPEYIAEAYPAARRRVQAGIRPDGGRRELLRDDRRGVGCASGDRSAGR